ncbi:MAG: 7-cyano-7-deazaguanine synthase QueC [Rickettsiales bacterium]
MEKRAIAIVSGGIDSTTLLAKLINEGYEVDVLSFLYGQRNTFEINKVKKIAKSYNVVTHKIIKLNLDQIGGSALTAEIDVPKNNYDKNSSDKDIPVTYVPARNTIFLSYALGWAEVRKINHIFFGAHIVDYSNYPDCRPEYIDAFEKMANLATEMGIKGKKIFIEAPFVKMAKSDIIKIGLDLGVDYSETISCYDPSLEGKSCGKCDACIIRLEGFAKNNKKDPIEYQ